MSRRPADEITEVSCPFAACAHRRVSPAEHTLCVELRLPVLKSSASLKHVMTSYCHRQPALDITVSMVAVQDAAVNRITAVLPPSEDDALSLAFQSKQNQTAGPF